MTVPIIEGEHTILRKRPFEALKQVRVDPADGLLGFGVDAVIDAVASAALIWRFRVEAQQPERAARVEGRAERVVGFALIALALYLAIASIRSLAAQAHPEASSASVALLLASALVLLPLAIAKYRVAARLGSGALRADSVLTAVAALLAGISLVSFAASQAFGWWWADAIAALIVGAIVVREGWTSLLLSRSVARALRLRVRASSRHPLRERFDTR